MTTRSLFFLLLVLVVACLNVWGEPPIRTIRGVRELTREQAASGLPVEVEGVVTYTDVQMNMMWIQDETDGIYVFRHKSFGALGDRVRIKAVTRFGTYSPSLGPPPEGWIEVQKLSSSPLPKPLPTTLPEAMTGARHDLLVTLSGVVRSVESNLIDSDSLRLDLIVSTRHGIIKARTPAVEPSRLEEYRAWINLPAELTGVMSGLGDETQQIRTISLCIPSPEYVRVDAAGLEKLFSQPPIPFTQLLRYSPSRTPSQRVHVRGAVAMVRPGEGLFLAEGHMVLWVRTPQPCDAKIGDILAVAGVPDSANGRISLADGIIRPVSVVEHAVPALVPQLLSAEAASQVQTGDSLAAVEGEVVHDGQIPASRLLTLRSGTRHFVARVPKASPASQQTFRAGTLLRVTGILESIHRGDAADGNDSAYSSFELLCRSDSDLSVLRAAPWLTAERLRFLVLALIVVLGLAGLWVWVLGRQVRRQTQIIEHQIYQETVAGERQRIARELHDTLEQELVGVQIQLNSLLYRLPEDNAEARVSIQHASAMLEHSRQETRRSVWELRSQMLEEGGLAGALRTMFQSPNSKTGTEVVVEIRGPERRLDRTTELQLLRIAQEAVTNAQKHADASRIVVTLDFRAGLDLCIHDDGRGFDPAVPPRDGALHFGLLGIKERACKIAAALDLQSVRGEGTTIRITLPAI